MEITIKILQIAIALLTFGLAVVTCMVLNPQKTFIRVYERVDNQLREVNIFRYEKIERFLKENGAAEHFGNWISPLKYFLLRFCCSMIGFLLGSLVNIPIALVLCWWVFRLPNICCSGLTAGIIKRCCHNSGRFIMPCRSRLRQEFS